MAPFAFKRGYDDLLLTEVQRKRELQAKNIAFRRHILESQKRSNYINEYERILGMLATKTLNGLQKKLLESRKKTLKQLANESLYPGRHDIYN